MVQGHCVAAIDGLNQLVDYLTEAHAKRYALTDEGLSRYVRDFYFYRLGPAGHQESQLGSHVNAYTAGGTAEAPISGSLNHMPLASEWLVVFLSDGAFEEQRGSEWAPRW